MMFNETLLFILYSLNLMASPLTSNNQKTDGNPTGAAITTSLPTMLETPEAAEHDEGMTLNVES